MEVREDLDLSECATILTTLTAREEMAKIRPKVLNIATGCTVSLDTKPRAPGTGPAGTEQPPSSSASVDFSTMRKLTLATGLKMLLDVKNILCARMTLTATSRWANHVTDTGRVRADIPVCRDVPPCWCSTRTGEDVSLPQLKTVKFQQPKHLPRVKREITSHHPETNLHQNLEIQEEMEAREDPKDLHLVLDLWEVVVGTLFHLIFHQEQFHLIPTQNKPVAD